MRKLTIELVPRSCFYNNVRSNVRRDEWDRLRKIVYRECGYQCAICGAEGRLSAHEVWEYNEETCVQRLAGMVALCDLCHHCKHLGHANIMAQRGQLDLTSVINHYCAVNECRFDEFVKDKELAFEDWRRRSELKWRLDISHLDEYSS